MVPFNDAAMIPIELSEIGVSYVLHSKDGQPVERAANEPFQVPGNGARALLETPKIAEDITFRILARKTLIDREVYLHQDATVKVGLDLGLAASIIDAPLLDPAIEAPTNTTPRLVDYGASVTVKIENSQEGVNYRLVYFDDDEEITLSDSLDVLGNRGDIQLPAKPVIEDCDIRIRVTKIFDPADNRPDQTDLLDTVLPLKVKANPALAVSAPSATIDFGGTSSIRILETQQSAKYQLYARVIPDSGFVYGTPPSGTAVITVPVSGQPDAQVTKPQGGGASWQIPAGYAPVGEAKSGAGGELMLNTGVLNDDSLIIVKVQKDHEVGDTTMPSALQLTQAALILVEPNPAQALTLAAGLGDSADNRVLAVAGGQPGVFYHFSFEADGADAGLPVYFQQRAPDDATKNKGIDQTRIGVDFVIARDALPIEADIAPDLARESLQTPLLEIGAAPAGATALTVRAVKARTGVVVALEQPVDMPAV